MAQVRPFRALRYSATAGLLDRLVAPPYDVTSPLEREHYLALDPHNVVHLTLPDSDEQAGRDLREWRDEGGLRPEPDPVVYALAQAYTGPHHLQPTRHGPALI